MENKFTLQRTISISDCDPTGKLRPSAFFIYMQELAELHAAQMGMARHEMIETGMIFLIYRQRLVMNEYPTYDDDMVMTTWPAPVEGPLFPRHYQFARPDGSLLGSAVSSWVLINLKTRRPMRPSALPKPLPALVAEAVLPLPTMLHIEEASLTQSRKVAYSDLDVNGHMNNTRYVDWVCDLLPLERLLDKGLTDIQVNYIAEGAPGAILSLFEKPDGVGTLFQGLDAGGRLIFQARAVMG